MLSFKYPDKNIPPLFSDNREVTYFFKVIFPTPSSFLLHHHLFADDVVVHPLIKKTNRVEKSRRFSKDIIHSRCRGISLAAAATPARARALRVSPRGDHLSSMVAVGRWPPRGDTRHRRVRSTIFSKWLLLLRRLLLLLLLLLLGRLYFVYLGSSRVSAATSARNPTCLRYYIRNVDMAVDACLSGMKRLDAALKKFFFK